MGRVLGPVSAHNILRSVRWLAAMANSGSKVRAVTKQGPLSLWACRLKQQALLGGLMRVACKQGEVG